MISQLVQLIIALKKFSNVIKIAKTYLEHALHKQKNQKIQIKYVFKLYNQFDACVSESAGAKAVFDCIVQNCAGSPSR